jgi:hypothetical protein
MALTLFISVAVIAVIITLICGVLDIYYSTKNKQTAKKQEK